VTAAPGPAPPPEQVPAELVADLLAEIRSVCSQLAAEDAPWRAAWLAGVLDYTLSDPLTAESLRTAVKVVGEWETKPDDPPTDPAPQRPEETPA